MKLVIDIGNTRIKWALHDDAALGAVHSAVHRDAVDEVLAAVCGGAQAAIDAVLVSNVAGPEIAERLSARIREQFSVEPWFAAVAAEGHGLVAAYADPARLGVDRWLALIAARRRVDGPVCVISAGTAITLDAADAAGQHLGGLIFAGPRLMARALEHNTKQIGATPTLSQASPATALLGRSTAESVGIASWLAVSAGIDRALGGVALQLAAVPTVLLTGGDAENLRDWLETETQISADLVLEGLLVAAED